MSYKVLVADKLSNKGIEILQGFQVDVKTGLSEDELVAIIGDYDAMLVRSETKVTAKILQAAKKLQIIGRAGVGVDNIDIPAATKKGVIVCNSPEGNTIAAAEQTFALLMSMARNIPQAHASLQKGEWNRSLFTGIELAGKTLGVIGLGKIGKRVIRYAQGVGMDILGYDPYVSEEQAQQLGIKLMGLDDVLSKSDFITFHIPKTKETQHMIDKNKIASMKDGVYIVNCARGGIIVEADLRDALGSGKVKAAAIDVFEFEPIQEGNPLIGAKNIITTPHLGASTAEAQENVAIDVAQQVVSVLNGGEASAAVNIPSLRRELLDPVKGFMGLAEKLGLFMSQMIKDESISDVEIGYTGKVADKEVAPLNLAILKGLLDYLEKGQVNFVNAETVARERGIKVKESKSAGADDYRSLIHLKVKTSKSSYDIGGTVFEEIGDVVVLLNGLQINLKPAGFILVVPNEDKPGIIGKIGTILGEQGVNIASMQVGRVKKAGSAIMLVNVEREVDDRVISSIEALSEINGKVRLVHL
jgi:D-3-phosphoglycerate dehydrogenase